MHRGAYALWRDRGQLVTNHFDPITRQRVLLGLGAPGRAEFLGAAAAQPAQAAGPQPTEASPLVSPGAGRAIPASSALAVGVAAASMAGSVPVQSEAQGGGVTPTVAPASATRPSEPLLPPHRKQCQPASPEKEGGRQGSGEKEVELQGSGELEHAGSGRAVGAPKSLEVSPPTSR